MGIHRFEAAGARLYHRVNGSLGWLSIGHGGYHLADAPQRDQLVNPQIHRQFVQTRAILDRCGDVRRKRARGRRPTPLATTRHGTMVGIHQGLAGREILDLADGCDRGVRVGRQRAHTPRTHGGGWSSIWSTRSDRFNVAPS